MNLVYAILFVLLHFALLLAATVSEGATAFWQAATPCRVNSDILIVLILLGRL